jgi:hypothetical protein
MTADVGVWAICVRWTRIKTWKMYTGAACLSLSLHESAHTSCRAKAGSECPSLLEIDKVRPPAGDDIYG